MQSRGSGWALLGDLGQVLASLASLSPPAESTGADPWEPLALAPQTGPPGWQRLVWSPFAILLWALGRRHELFVVPTAAEPLGPRQVEGGALCGPPSPKVPSAADGGAPKRGHGPHTLSEAGPGGIRADKAWVAPELWGLEDFLWFCFGGRACVCWGWGGGGSSGGAPAPRFAGGYE